MSFTTNDSVENNDSKMQASDGSDDDFASESDESGFSEEEDSDDALRELFLQNKLKPGLNVIQKVTHAPVNDQEKLQAALEMIKLKAPWIERMDLVNDLAPLTPELAIQIEKHEQKRENQFKGNRKIPYVAPELDPVLNDFKREIMFHRQAQAATIEGIRRLHELGVTTKRPNDYFAEMAKSDEHMKRITKVLQDKQEGIAKSERIRQLREQRRIGKLIQRQATEKRDEERRKMLSDVKKFRKGKLANLDFLDGDGDDDEGPRGDFRKSGKPKPSKKQAAKISSGKRKARDAKFGFGGRKKGMKRNTRDSCMDDGRKKRPAGGKGGAAKNRPGKSRRSQGKNQRKK
ncbi:probable rRNA-processing protein EBP2 homolog isoform X2 [Anopheles coustani]|uniref:probable rRNA-processing protein EBP2 homolog isoform X2 n=1 Tax=Anopheles coustani TaxID=139045 RepID=UPI002658FF66|nr:probable rRNA-processing protein EBP2 homolog isoform X2 [Anopheles coustani]